MAHHSGEGGGGGECKCEGLTKLEIGIGGTDVVEGTHEPLQNECNSCTYSTIINPYIQYHH